MHHIYHTHGFVLSSRNMGEANKMLTIYTREMGLIRAMSQGIRLHKSKLRFALQDFSYAKVDFVRGRDIWRVTSATTISSFPFARADKDSILLIARISKLSERLCGAEEINERIYDDLLQALHLLDDPLTSVTTREALEIFLVLRIMNTLGYIGDTEMFKKYIGGTFDSFNVETLLGERQYIVNYINKAMNESQL